MLKTEPGRALATRPTRALTSKRGSVEQQEEPYPDQQHECHENRRRAEILRKSRQLVALESDPVDGRFDRLEVGEGRDGLRFEQGAELATAGEPDDGQGVLLRDELGELLLELCPNLGQLAVNRAATVDDEDVVGGGLDRLGRGCRIDGLTNQEQLVRDLVRRLAHGWVSLTF